MQSSTTNIVNGSNNGAVTLTIALGIVAVIIIAVVAVIIINKNKKD